MLNLADTSCCQGQFRAASRPSCSSPTREAKVRGGNGFHLLVIEQNAPKPRDLLGVLVEVDEDLANDGENWILARGKFILWMSNPTRCRAPGTALKLLFAAHAAKDCPHVEPASAARPVLAIDCRRKNALGSTDVPCGVLVFEMICTPPNVRDLPGRS